MDESQKTRRKPLRALLSTLRQRCRPLSQGLPGFRRKGQGRPGPNLVVPLEWEGLRFRLRPTEAEVPLDRQHQADLAAAREYRDLLNQPGWDRYEREVEAQAEAAVGRLVGYRPLNPEDAWKELVRTGEFVAACYNVLAIPRHAIEIAKGEGGQNA